MKPVFKSLLAAATVAVAATGAQAQEAKSLKDLLDQVQQNRVSEARLDKQREAEFQSARADKQALLRKAQADLKAEQARGDRLQKQFSDNEVTLNEKAAELDQATGTLGEMFGVVRQASSEAYGRISTSIVSAQFPGRGQFLAEMSEDSKGLPNIKELEDLWFALQKEMTEGGEVVKFTTEVVNLDGHFVASADELIDATSGFVPFYADPSQGAILGLLKQKATMAERYHAGGPVGYTITVMLAIGLLIGIYKMITLTITGGKMRSQLKNVNNPSEGNPLGRILKVYQENKTADAENLELKLDEAILRELPKIESGINVIKIFAAIAPLLGLLGTVLGMIETFQTITLFGTGDPRMMAGSISMALVTTAQGIIAALPLILTHSIVASRSKSIIHILDEQTAGIVAAHSESEKA
jgi:biopolymer transport protein ExbB